MKLPINYVERNMKHVIRSKPPIFLALIATGFYFSVNLVAAQELIEEIIIRAPYESIHVKSTTTPNLKTEIMELKRRVSINDLDLAKYADVAELNSRIESVAKESCQELSELSPLNRSNPAEMSRCKKNAIASTKQQTDQAIAEAN